MGYHQRGCVCIHSFCSFSVLDIVVQRSVHLGTKLVAMWICIHIRRTHFEAVGSNLRVGKVCRPYFSSNENRCSLLFGRYSSRNRLVHLREHFYLRRWGKIMQIWWIFTLVLLSYSHHLWLPVHVVLPGGHFCSNWCILPVQGLEYRVNWGRLGNLIKGSRSTTNNWKCSKLQSKVGILQDWITRSLITTRSTQIDQVRIIRLPGLLAASITDWWDKSLWIARASVPLWLFREQTKLDGLVLGL